ncbi:MAG: protein kinase, partial [Planctomycetota bacterium]
MSTAWLPVVVNGRYRLIGKLGQGSTGMVLLAEDQLQENRLLALKALGAAASASDAVALFKHEFRALKDLRHPHLAEVYDFGVVTSLDPWDAGPPGLPVRAGFYTMEHVPGEEFLAATSGLDFPDLIDLAAQVCRGLEYIHARGLVHYDVKSSNLRV